MSVKNRMIEEALERMEAEYETAAELQVAMEAQAFAEGWDSLAAKILHTVLLMEEDQ
jgi:hypothetical protein